MKTNRQQPVLQKIANSEDQVPLYQPCAICGEDIGTRLGRLSYALPESVRLAGDYDLVCCSGCGFVGINTPSTQADYDQFYEQSFYSPEYLAKSASEEELVYFEETVKLFARQGDLESHPVFDIGCGLGFQLEAFGAQGYEPLYGIDPSKACVSLLNQKPKISGLEGKLGDLPSRDIRLERVLLSHILEHIIDLPTALADLNSKMGNGDKIYIEVPDSPRYDQFGKGKPLSFLYFQHTLHFDQFHLCQLLGRFGYRQVDKGERDRIERGFIMPAIWGVFERDSRYSNEIRPDYSLADKLMYWFESTNLDPNGELEKLAISGRPVYVWGMGIHAQMLLNMSPLSRCNLIALVDKNPAMHGIKLGGKVIKPLDELKSAGADAVVFLSALVHTDSMRNYLEKQLGFAGTVMQL